MDKPHFWSLKSQISHRLAQNSLNRNKIFRKDDCSDAEEGKQKIWRKLKDSSKFVPKQGQEEILQREKIWFLKLKSDCPWPNSQWPPNLHPSQQDIQQNNDEDSQSEKKYSQYLAKCLQNQKKSKSSQLTGDFSWCWNVREIQFLWENPDYGLGRNPH